MDYNKVILAGRLTADPEMRMTTNGIGCCRFTIATNRSYKLQDGTRPVDFNNIVAWKSTAKFITDYFKKGDSICIEGQLQSRKYTDKNNTVHYIIEVKADQCFFTEGRRKTSNNLPPTDNSETFPEYDSPNNDNFSYQTPPSIYDECDDSEDFPV